MKLLRIYTDGSASYKNRAGGWATVVFDKDGIEIARFSGRKQDTTNNQMELHGYAQALMYILQLPEDEQKNTAFEIYSDSEYVVNGATTWLAGWKAKDWKKVKNVDYWLIIDGLQRRVVSPLETKWVRGHNGNPFNELCDKIAGEEYATAVKEQEKK